MEKILYAAMCAVLFFCCSSSDEPEADCQSPFTLPDKAIVLAEQASKSDRKSTRLNSSHNRESRMPSSA